MSNYLYEVRATKQRRSKIVLVPYSELINYQGFRSLYGYPEDAAKHIQATSSTADMRTFPVYSDLLLVDFDDQPEAAHAMAEALREYDWVKFDSGGRSIHLHVRIEPMLGPWVPALQKAYMEQNFPKADLSIYRTSGIYRMAGTYHEKYPGRRKEIIETNITGKSLILNVAIPEPTVALPPKDDEDLQDLLGNLLGMQIGKGTTGRNYHAFKIAKVANRLGLDSGSTERLVDIWNSTLCNPPLDENSIRAAIKSAYRSYHGS